jgi:L-ascorbate metabolism protein UlaG (beta-lactamase superfamily)
MAVTFTWLGHSAFSFDIDGHPLLIDPFLTGNPLAAAAPDSLHPEILFLSHAHGDHLGDTVDIARQSGALVVGNWEIHEWMQRQGITNTHPLNTGGSRDFGIVHAKQTLALHSSSFPDGTYGGLAGGYLFNVRGMNMTIYYAGDTDVFRDMEWIGDVGIDLAFLPIGDNFTMGPEESLRAIRLLRPRMVVPMHYNTFDFIVQDAGAWANRVSSETDAQPIVLDPGGSYTIS